VTPWGRALKPETPDPLPAYVSLLKPRFPVALAQWDDDIDARFPLQMLDRAGTICLASDRKLPPPAQKIIPPTKPIARFAREPIWHNPDGQTAILSGVLAAFEADFRTPRDIGARDEEVGFLEVLLAPSDHFGKKTPTPDQGEEGTGEGDDRVLSVAFERRRLIAPAGSRKGEWLRARVPLWIPSNLPGSETWVWTRVVPRIGARGAWEKTDSFFITSR